LQSVRRERSAPFGSSASGMPFGGYPAFQLSPRDRPVKDCRSSRRLPCLSKASDFQTPRRTCCARGPACAGTLTAPSPADRSPRAKSTAALLSLCCSTAHEARGARPASRRDTATGAEAPVAATPARVKVAGKPTPFRLSWDEGCHPPSGARWTFLRPQRAASARTGPTSDRSHPPHRSEHSSDRPGLFHPGNAPELSPSGLCSPRRSRFVSEPDPPVPLDATRWRCRRLRRVDPSAGATPTGRNRSTPSALLALSPLRLSLSPP
jgi:hypothetical protein